jgi:cytochrome P450
LAKGPEVVPAIVEQCKRERLDPEGLGAAIYAAADRGEISGEEAAMLVRSLLSAGVDTTVSGIGNTIWCLAGNPGAFEQLKAEPRLARAAFEEALRLTSPVHSFCRTAPNATEVSGVAIPQDAKILCVLGAANLDPEFWPNADCFDIARAAGAHLAFGVGIHGCVGQNIARAEAEALLTAIVRKVDAIELAGEPVWRANNAIHALANLPVRFAAR